MTATSKTIEQGRIRSGIQPISWIPSLAILVVMSAVQYLAHYIFISFNIKQTGQPYLVGYLYAWGSTITILLAVSLGLYLLEGQPIRWDAFSSRYRLAHMTRADWFWAVATLLFTRACYFGLSFTARCLASIPLFAHHPIAPAELGPDGIAKAIPGQLFGMVLKGQWWVVIVYYFGWISNILGEEFFYRGWLLPRQELAFGRNAWLVNATVFTLQQWLQPLNFLAIWPGALFMVFACQRQCNTWITIIQHGVLNFCLFVIIVRMVIG